MLMQGSKTYEYRNWAIYEFIGFCEMTVVSTPKKMSQDLIWVLEIKQTKNLEAKLEFSKLAKCM